MATAADELLNDFEDSGDENEQEQVDDQYFGESGGVSSDAHGSKSAGTADNGGMEVDGDEEDADDVALDGTNVPSHLKMEEEETEEETKARVEQMELQNVSDVRSVAGLMKQLDPLLQVSRPSPKHVLYCHC